MAPKKEFSPLSMVLTLIVTCVMSGVILSGVDRMTRGPIAQALRQENLAAIQAVLPAYANKPDQEAIEVEGVRLYPARNADGQLVGVAVSASDPLKKAYAGEMELMIGLDAEGRLTAIEKVVLNETPGLGDGVLSDKFTSPLLGLDARSIRWQVKQDGGDVDAVTAATISSRAALRAIESAFTAHEKAGLK